MKRHVCLYLDSFQSLLTLLANDHGASSSRLTRLRPLTSHYYYYESVPGQHVCLCLPCFASCPDSSTRRQGVAAASLRHYPCRSDLLNSLLFAWLDYSCHPCRVSLSRFYCCSAYYYTSPTAFPSVSNAFLFICLSFLIVVDACRQAEAVELSTTDRVNLPGIGEDPDVSIVQSPDRYKEQNDKGRSSSGGQLICLASNYCLLYVHLPGKATGPSILRPSTIAFTSPRPRGGQ